MGCVERSVGDRVEAGVRGLPGPVCTGCPSLAARGLSRSGASFRAGSTRTRDRTSATSGFNSHRDRLDFPGPRPALAPGFLGFLGPPAQSRTGTSGLSRPPGRHLHRDLLDFHGPRPQLAPRLAGVSPGPPAGTRTGTSRPSRAPGRRLHRDVWTFSGPSASTRTGTSGLTWAPGRSRTAVPTAASRFF